MPTTIRFAGAPDNLIEVEEDAETVSAALARGAESPIALTRTLDGSRVFVNASVVACWFDGREARPREDSGVASSMSPF